MRLPNRKYPLAKVRPIDHNITQKKYNGLQIKLKKLITIDRPQVAQEVANLAHDGDFSENAGYQAAKQVLRSINNNIMRIEKILNNAQIINKSTTDSVQIGSRVTVNFNGQTKTLEILGSSETDPSHNIISNNSPIGAALLNKQVGETAIIKIKNKTLKYKVLSIQ